MLAVSQLFSLSQLSQTFSLSPTTTLIIFESFVAGIATLLGAAMVCSLGRPRIRLLSAFMGFAAGVMTCVVLLDLLPYSYSYGSLLYTALGFWLGVILMKLLKGLVYRLASLKKNVPNPNAPKQTNRYFQLGILVGVGIALHDLPEGMAIAAGHTAHTETGLMLALAIGIHNIPEGIAAATPFVMSGSKKWKILLLMLIISFFTPLGAGLGILLLSLGDVLISTLLALSAGAMISLVTHDLWPEAWQGNHLTASLGFLLGCVLLLFLTFFMHV
jgi:ZIP family zinc transporter